MNYVFISLGHILIGIELLDCIVTLVISGKTVKCFSKVALPLYKAFSTAVYEVSNSSTVSQTVVIVYHVRACVIRIRKNFLYVNCTKY